MNREGFVETRSIALLLIRTQLRCARNYVRHHFDLGTLVRLVLLAGLLVAGIVVPGFKEALGAPEAKARWNPLPRLFLCAILSFPGGLRRESGSPWAVYSLLPISRRSLAIYDLFHRLALPVILAFVLSLMDIARAVFHPIWWPRVALDILAFLIAGTAGTAIAALWPRKARGVPAPASKTGGLAAAGAGLRIPGRGTLRELIRLDVLYLVRRNLSVLLTAAAVTILAAIAAARATSAEQGMFLVILIEGIAALLLVNQLLGLFEKDLVMIDRLKALPIAGRDVWRSRWIVAAVLSIAPGIAGALTLALRFGITARWFPVPVAILLIVTGFATLYANVGLTLFPRIQLMALFLNLAWALPVGAWFLAPPVSLVLLAIAIGYGLRTAGPAYDRLEIS